MYASIRETIDKGFRVLVTTLTKKMSEDLTDYLKEMGIKTEYLHSSVITMKRMEIIRDLRQGEFDVLVGINLLREGLDIPEVALVAILDADKEGFLRSETSLIQTIGRAARNSESKVIMYADTITKAMKSAISETTRRRALQIEYNEKHGIVPTTVLKGVRDVLQTKIAEGTSTYNTDAETDKLSNKEIEKLIAKQEREMKQAAKELQFERAAQLRDEINKLKEKLQ